MNSRPTDRNRLVIRGGLLAALVAIGCLLALGSTGNGPTWEGRSARDWLEGFMDEKPDLRAASREAFRGMGAEAIPFLRDALARRDSSARRWMMRWRDWAVMLPGHWRSARQWRNAALYAVTSLGPGALPLLPDVCQSASLEWSEHLAVGAVVSMGPGALSGLLELAPSLVPGSESDVVVWGAMKALTHAHAMPPGLTRRLVVECNSSLKQRQSAGARHICIAIMDTLAEVAEHASSSLPQVRICAKDSDWMVRAAAVRTMIAIGGPPEDSVAEFEGHLKDAHAGVRELAVRGLSGYGDWARPAVGSIGRLVGDPAVSVQMAALGTLQGLGARSVSATPAVSKALREGGSAVRAKAARVMAAVKPDAAEAVPALALALGDEDWHVRCAAAEALGVYGPEAALALDSLIAALADHREPVQISVVEALGSIGPAARKAVPQLQAAWNNNQSALGVPVRDALRRIERDL